MECEWLGMFLTHRLLLVKAHRAPSPLRAWPCPYPHSVFSCQPSHSTTPQIYDYLGLPASEGKLGASTQTNKTIRQCNTRQWALRGVYVFCIKAFSYRAPQHWSGKDLSSPLPGPYTQAYRHFWSSGSLYCTLAFVFGILLSQLESQKTGRELSLSKDKYSPTQL